MKLKFRQAHPEQIPEVLELFRTTSEKLRKKGLSQWSYWADPPPDKIEWVRSGFEKGEFYYVLSEENEWLGIFRLLETDTLYWDAKGLEKGVRYIHSLVVTPENSGLGIGSLVLEKLLKTLEKESVEKLRLDCDASNKRLCQYYTDHGFSKVGEKKTPFSVNILFEIVL